MNSRHLLIAITALNLVGCQGLNFDEPIFFFALVCTSLVALLGVLTGKRIHRSPAPLGALAFVGTAAFGLVVFVGTALWTRGFRPWPASFAWRLFVLFWLASPPVFAALYAGARFVHDRSPKKLAWYVAGGLAACYVGLLVLASVSNMRPRLEGQVVAVAVSDARSYGLTDHGVLVTLPDAQALPGTYQSVRASGSAVLAVDMDGRVLLFLEQFGAPPKLLPASLHGTVRSLAVGHDRACVIDGHGKVLCLPFKLDGSLASPARAISIGAGVRVLDALEAAHEVAIADGVVCAADTKREIRCQWSGEKVEVIGQGTSLATTYNDACFLDADRVVNCRRLGEKDEDNPVEPRPLGETRALQVVAGGWHACARTEANEVHCWGANGWNQLARSSTNKGSAKALPVPLNERARELFAFSRSTCALLEGGSIACWGAMDAPATIVSSRVCDKRLLAPDVWCAEAPASIQLPTSFIPYEEK